MAHETDKLFAAARPEDTMSEHHIHDTGQPTTPSTAMPPRAGSPSVNDDTIEMNMRRKRSGVSTTLIVICLVLLFVGLATFAFVHYLPMRQELESLRAEVASLSSAGEHAEAAELAELRASNEELRARLSALESEHESLSEQAAALRAEREQAEAALAELRERMQAEIASGDVSVRSEGGNLGIGLASRVLFRSGSADLSPRGHRILRRVAVTLLRVESRAIQVGGHTDSNPISEALQEQYPTNWELSTARATNVVRFLQDECEVPGSRLIAAGLAEHRPAATNRTNRGRLLNRRIELTLIPLPTGAPAE